MATQENAARSGSFMKPFLGVSAGVPVGAWLTIGITTGDWNPIDGYDFSDILCNTCDTENAVQNVTEVVQEKVGAVVEAPAQATAAVAAPCATEEVVEEVQKVCVGPQEELVATADSSCDGVISLTRQALLQDTSFVTPELVDGIENPLVKSVYQALLDGDRAALTAALAEVYTENGYFVPENASGVLDGLKDSIIIYPGDQMVVNEDGWFLKRDGGEMIKVVSCSGELLDVKEEVMSDTGTCGGTKVIPVAELPQEEVEPLCDDACTDTPLDKALAATTVETDGLFQMAESTRGVVAPEVEAALRETNRAVPVLVPTDDGRVPFLMSENAITPTDVQNAVENGYAVRSEDGTIKLFVQPVNPQTGELMDPYCVEWIDKNRDGVPDSPRPVEGQVYDTDERVVFNSAKAGQQLQLRNERGVFTAVGIESWMRELKNLGGIKLAQ